MTVDLMLGDCLDRMAEIADGSVDLVAADLPYGSTHCAWDTVIPLAPLWAHYQRVLKPAGAIVLTATQPFASALVMSNPRWFRYDLVWDKVNRITGALNASRMPLRRHESALVFYRRLPVYNPQWLDRPPVTGGHKSGHGKHTAAGDVLKRDRRADPPRCNPSSIIAIPGAGKAHTGLHPTQKPVPLFEWIVRTFTNPGGLVLDNAMGVGTTGLACLNTGRRFVGIELDPGFFEIARARIAAAMPAPADLEMELA